MKKIIAFLSGFLIFCELPQQEEYELEPVIFGVLNPGKFCQTIVVDKTHSVDDTVLSRVKGARVVVKSGRGLEIEFKEDSLTPGYYYAFGNDWIVPDASYFLEVLLPWGDTVYGGTRVPSKISILQPSNFDTISLSNPPSLIWSSAENKFMYFVYAFPWLPDTGWIDSLPRTYIFPLLDTDTIMPLFEMGKGSIFKEKDTLYTIKVFAIEENYFKYWYYDSTTLSGGRGLFGGLSEDSIRVYIRE